MKAINDKDIYTIFIIKGKPYVYAPYEEKNKCKIGDTFIDFRTGYFKTVENEQDLIDLSFVAPELYCSLREVNLFKILEEKNEGSEMNV